MNAPRCRVVPESLRYRRIALRGISFDRKRLSIDLQGEGFSFACLTFEWIIGFRVLDERDLCEFWNEYSEPNGWLYEVEAGGWMELESHRDNFSSRIFHPNAREYLLVDDWCVSILSSMPPVITDCGADPPAAS
jgi:hypothetical protein